MLLYYCSIPVYRYRTVMCTFVSSLGRNFVLVHGVTFGDGILNVLPRRRSKEEKS